MLIPAKGFRAGFSPSLRPNRLRLQTRQFGRARIAVFQDNLRCNPRLASIGLCEIVFRGVLTFNIGFMVPFKSYLTGGCAKRLMLAIPLLACGEMSAVVCEMPDSSFLNLGEFVGTDAFYARGVYGQGVKVANLELYVASREEDPEYAVFLKDAAYSTYCPEGETERFGSPHPYQTLSVMAGYNVDFENQAVSTGLAHQAEYVSGQVGENSMAVSDRSVLSTYGEFFTNGTDVISSSWKNSGDSSFMTGAVLDSYAAKNHHTVFVAAAANDGEEGPGHVSSPYKNMNVISVGALDDASNFGSVAKTSSYGPNDFYNPVTGETVKGVVSAVDIAAPGTVYTVLRDGTLGNSRGTSFAAPVVSSAAALMISHSRLASMPADSRDARLIRAVLLNSADKIAGWDNGAELRDFVGADGKVHSGVLSTSQSLDYRSGAGALNAAEALAQYDNFGNTSFLGSVGEGGSYSYAFRADGAGMEFAATLCWMVGSDVSGVSYDESGDVSAIDADFSHFSNLDLRLWHVGSDGEMLVAQSVSEYNNVEHIFLELSSGGEYRLEVVFDGMVYGDSPEETYAIAWNLSAVPEPSSCAVLFGAAALVFAALRRRN